MSQISIAPVFLILPSCNEERLRCKSICTSSFVHSRIKISFLMIVKYAKENQLNMINGDNIMREIYKYDKLS